MSNILESLNNLSPEKRALLALRLKLKGAAASRVQKIPRRENNEAIPLSYAQQRLWFIWKMEPDSIEDNIAVALRITGPLNVQGMERTFSELINRHEILRTNFPEVDGLPIQRINPPQELRLPLVDLSELDEASREARAEQLISEEERRPFDLMNGRMLRVGLVKMHEQEHLLLLTMHHVVSDGWSMSILIREVSTLYDAYSKGNSSSLPELPIQYADYALWQRAQLSGDALDGPLAYWKQQLAGASQVLELRTDRARSASPTSSSNTIGFVLPPGVTEAVKELSRSERTTLFMTFMAAFKVLLYRYTGQSDISVGTPYANRNLEEVQGLIGIFINVLVMRTDMSGNPGFRELLARVKKVAVDAYANQDVPFEKLVEVLKPDRNLSQTPLFQVMFAFHNWDQESLKLNELNERSIRRESAATTKYDLSLEMMEHEGSIRGMLQYKSELFDESTITRMVEHFQRLVENAVFKPEQPISTLRMMSPQEQQLLLEQWDNTKGHDQTTKCLDELFEEQVARTPEATAVVLGEEQINYRQLNERANQLARRLREQGVRPEVIVGILLERSVEMIVAIFGVLKAGGAYLPLDRNLPVERVAWMMEDAGVEVLLTQESLKDWLPQRGRELRYVLVEQIHNSEGAQVEERVESGVTGDNLAYVIYTSGSTGIPKGVCISHIAAANHFLVALEEYRIDSTDVVLVFASFNFDASVEEIFTGLLTGAALVLRGDPWGREDFFQCVADSGLTIVNFPPAYWTQIVPAPGSETAALLAARLKLITIGGDQMPPQTARLWQQSGLQDLRLLNGYGPTETVVTATLFDVPPLTEEDAASSQVPIGRPLAHRAIYILDQQGAPVPVGVTGELHLGGSLLARGYLNRPDLTAEKFIPDPFIGEAGARMYRTGDKATYLEDGQLRFLGRVDNQVKIRGYRIELGEIEAGLYACDGVREAAVMVNERVAGEKRLIGYVVMEPGQTVVPGKIKEHLRKRLPDYMVPTSFVELEKMPLTTNGKIDRRALPAPDEAARNIDLQYVEPKGPTEEIIAGIWSSVLAIGRVGAEDNFFDLGGHSLLATQVISRVREALGVEVPLRTLFEQPTVRGLAATVAGHLRAGERVRSLPLVPVGRDRALPLSFAQQRLWFLDQLEPQSSTYNMPAALRLTGALDRVALERSLSEVVRRHEALRTTFAETDGEPTQIIQPAQAIAVPLFDLSHLPETEREQQAQQLVAEEAARPFDLAAGPLLRAALIRLSGEEHIALLTMHHIISDGWSMGVFIREMGALYEAYQKQEESPLSELAIQYADYAVWQREWLQGEVLDEQLSYWREQLGGAPALLELPTDRPRTKEQSHRGAHHGFTLEKAVADGL
ncbi:MAG TPA: amino acid adenylation domain-containing protein, partial [Pyrinomonadaceae bacterium]